MFLAFITSGFAQDYSTVKEKAHEDINVLFAKKKSTEDKTQIDLGWSVGLNTAYTQFDKKNVWLLGVNMGVILNHNWTLGIKAQGIVNSTTSIIRSIPQMPRLWGDMADSFFSIHFPEVCCTCDIPADGGRRLHGLSYKLWK